MKTHLDKKQEKKSQSVANAVSQRQSSRESTFQFVDNRPEAVAQRKLQKVANNSSKAKEVTQLQEIANAKTIQKFPFDEDGKDLGSTGTGGGRGLQGSGLLQIGGGFLTAAANVFGTATGLFNTASLFPIAERRGPLPAGRRELQGVVEPYRTGEDTRASEMAEMITGQNGAQSLMRQPVGPHAIHTFDDQLKEMQAVSDRPRSEQYGAEFSGHLNLMSAFLRDHQENPNAGLWSGIGLHGIGAGYSAIMGAGHSMRENPERAAQSFLDAQRGDDTNFSGGL